MHTLRITQAEDGPISVMVDGHELADLTNYLVLTITPGGAELALTVTLAGLDLDTDVKAELSRVTLEDLWRIGDYPESVPDD